MEWLNLIHSKGQKDESGNPAPCLLMSLWYKGRSLKRQMASVFSFQNYSRVSPRRADSTKACYVHTKWTYKTLWAQEDLYTEDYKTFPVPSGNLDLKSWPSSELQHQQQPAVWLHLHSEPPMALTCSFMLRKGDGSIWSWKNTRKKIHLGWQAGEGHSPWLLTHITRQRHSCSSLEDPKNCEEAIPKELQGWGLSQARLIAWRSEPSLCSLVHRTFHVGQKEAFKKLTMYPGFIPLRPRVRG